MKVWIVAVAEPLPSIDGGFRPFRCSLLSDALISHGHRVVWWTSDFDHVRKVHRLGRTQSIEINNSFKLNLLHGPGYKSNISLSRVWHNFRVASVFESEADSERIRPDVLFVCLPILELAERAAIYGQGHQVPVILDVRDQWPDLYLNAFPARFRSVARLALLTEFRRLKRILRKATAITAVSETYLTWALQSAGRERQDKDIVFPLGCSEQSADEHDEIERKAQELSVKHGIRSDSLVVTFVGTFGASYDLETVIHAARQLGHLPEIQIVVAGDGDAGSKLRQIGQDLKNVIFTGWLDRTSISALLKLSSVGLAPYKNEAWQSLPNKPFEYWAASLPILSSLKGELAALIQKEQVGLQYKSGDVSSLVGAIRWFQVNEYSRRIMARRARKLFDERFSARMIYPKLVEYLEEVHSAAPRGR
jgi:glycosyltransferase involved in cell wall biosynthesis